ncbi:MAG: ASCH domain-containing protein [Candidatus Hodarchaeota archaeon]
MNNVQSFPAISIRQPWAELILRGKKTIEVRSWDSAYRGMLYLHTGKFPYGYKALDLGLQDVFRGGYVGTIELAAIVPFTLELWEQWRELHLLDGQFRQGLFAWMIRNPRRFKNPIPGPGALGIFHPDPSVAKTLENAPILNSTQR